MKLAVSNIAWDDNDEYHYDTMQRYGFTGLEIAPTKFSTDPYDNLLVAIKTKQLLLTKYQLSIVSMQSLLFGTTGMFLFTSIESRKLLFAYLEKAIIYAKNIGCPVLVFGSPKNRILVEKNKDYQIAIDFFRKLGDFAKKHSTCLCIEPNSKEYKTNFINTLNEANILVNDVDSDGFKMIVDTSTMILNKEHPDEVMNVFANTKHIHISMPFLKSLHQEYHKYEQWLKYLIQLIKSVEYNNYISIEMSNITHKEVELSMGKLLQLI